MDYKANQTLEFREIVLTHLKRILDLSSHELRDSTSIITKPNMTDIIEHEDTRISYIQSIENLAYVLLPHFDKKIKETYEKCIKVITQFDYEVTETCKKEYEMVNKKREKPLDYRVFAIEMRLRYAKLLFRELNLLLNRVGYLKTSIYGEGVEEEDIVDVDVNEED